MTAWHENDEFWVMFAPLMFTEKRWAAAVTDVEQVLDLVDVAPGAAVLDLACGVGRHSLPLAERGFDVTGVDRTGPYLELAGRRAKEAGLDIEFVHADMRDFVRPQSFDLVLSLYTSFGYFEDPNENARVLENVARSLRPGGHVVLQMHGKETLARIFQARDWREEGDALFLQEREVSRNWSWMKNRWILVRDGERYEVELSHWLYSAVELTALLQGAGFESIEVYGDFEGSPYDRDASSLVVVGRIGDTA